MLVSIANSKLVNSTITLQEDSNSTTLTLQIHLRLVQMTPPCHHQPLQDAVDQVLFSVNVDDSSIEIDSSNGLQVKAGGITNAMLAQVTIAVKLLYTISTVNKVSISALNMVTCLSSR